MPKGYPIKTQKQSAEEASARQDSPNGGLAAIRRANGWDAASHPEPRVVTRPAARRRPADGTRLGRELADLEDADPAVAAAADRLDDAVERIIDRPYPNLAATVERQRRHRDAEW